MGKQGNNKGRQRQRRADRRLTQRATSNVELQDTGQANQLQAQLQQAQQDYLRSTQAAQSIYPGAQEAMANVERPQFGQIQSDFDTALGTVKGMFGGDQAAPYMSAGEGDAGMGLGNAYGEAGATMLANAGAREGMFRSSAERQAGLAGQYAEDALLQQMQDTVQGYNNQMGQLRADDPWQIQQESQSLWDRQQQQRALASKLQSDKAFSEWLQGRAGDMASGGNPGRPGPGGGGGGGGNGTGYTGPTTAGGYSRPGPGTQSHAAIDNQGMAPQPGWRQNAVQDTRQAVNAQPGHGPDEVAGLPGWVRYAYNHGGANALQNPDRQRLYNRRLEGILPRRVQ